MNRTHKEGFHGHLVFWQDAFVGVTDGKIAYMAKKPPEEKPKKIIDATGMVLMPGLINCHTHLPMYLLRGYADDLNLQDWLQHYIFRNRAFFKKLGIK